MKHWPYYFDTNVSTAFNFIVHEQAIKKNCCFCVFTVYSVHCTRIALQMYSGFNARNSNKNLISNPYIDLFRQTASKFRYFCSQTCEFSRTKFWSMFSSEREIKAPSILLWLEIEWMIVVMGDFECVPMCHFGGLSLHIVFNATEFKNCHVHRIIPLHRYCAGDVTALIHQQQHL